MLPERVTRDRLLPIQIAKDMAPEKPATRSAKTRKVEVRIDEDLAQQVEAKAESRGWSLASVMRALLELWVQEDVIDPKDVGKAAKRAPRSKKSKSGQG